MSSIQLRQPARRQGGRLCGEISVEAQVRVIRRYNTPHGARFEVELIEAAGGYPPGHRLIGVREVRS